MQVFGLSLDDCFATKPQSKRQQRRYFAWIFRLLLVSVLSVSCQLFSLESSMHCAILAKIVRAAECFTTEDVLYWAAKISKVRDCWCELLGLEQRLGVCTGVSCALAERGLVANDPSRKHAANQVPAQPLGSLNMVDSSQILYFLHCIQNFFESRSPGLHIQYATLIFQPLQV